MSTPFEFSQSKIDDHVAKVGVDIRPVIEPKLDRSRLFDLGSRFVDIYPNLFQSLVQSAVDFRITKRFIFPGKGEVELDTLAITARGIVFIFPHKLGMFDEEIEQNNIIDISAQCLKIFREVFPGKKLIRVGLVNEYVFGTGNIDGARLIAQGFTKVTVPPGGDVRLRVNRPTDDYNRVIELQPIAKLEPVPELGRMQAKSFGIKVMVDFNNRETDKDLDQGSILTVLHEGMDYNRDPLYHFLNTREEMEQ